MSKRKPADYPCGDTEFNADIVIDHQLLHSSHNKMVENHFGTPDMDPQIVDLTQTSYENLNCEYFRVALLFDPDNNTDNFDIDYQVHDIRNGDPELLDGWSFNYYSIQFFTGLKERGLTSINLRKGKKNFFSKVIVVLEGMVGNVVAYHGDITNEHPFLPDTSPCAEWPFDCDSPDLISCVLGRHLLSVDEFLQRVYNYAGDLTIEPKKYTVQELNVPSDCNEWLLRFTFEDTGIHTDITYDRLEWPPATPRSQTGCAYYSYVLFNALVKKTHATHVHVYKGQEDVGNGTIVTALIQVYCNSTLVYIGDLTNELPFYTPEITLP